MNHILPRVEVSNNSIRDILSALIYTIIGCRFLSNVTFTDIDCESIALTYAKINNTGITDSIDATISEIHSNLVLKYELQIEVIFYLNIKFDGWISPQIKEHVFERWVLPINLNTKKKDAGHTQTFNTCMNIIHNCSSKIDHLPDNFSLYQYKIVYGNDKQINMSWFTKTIINTVKSGLSNVL